MRTTLILARLDSALHAQTHADHEFARDPGGTYPESPRDIPGTDRIPAGFQVDLSFK
jgi:hypothetical protein